jgi:hypothetical protein
MFKVKWVGWVSFHVNIGVCFERTMGGGGLSSPIGTVDRKPCKMNHYSLHPVVL